MHVKTAFEYANEYEKSETKEREMIPIKRQRAREMRGFFFIYIRSKRLDCNGNNFYACSLLQYRGFQSSVLFHCHQNLKWFQGAFCSIRSKDQFIFLFLPALLLLPSHLLLAHLFHFNRLHTFHPIHSTRNIYTFSFWSSVGTRFSSETKPLCIDQEQTIHSHIDWIDGTIEFNCWCVLQQNKRYVLLQPANTFNQQQQSHSMWVCSLLTRVPVWEWMQIFLW